MSVRLLYFFWWIVKSSCVYLSNCQNVELSLLLSGLCNREAIKISLFLFSLLLCVYLPHIQYLAHTNTHFDMCRGIRGFPGLSLTNGWRLIGILKVAVVWDVPTQQLAQGIIQHLFLNQWVSSLLRDAGWGDHRPSVWKQASLLHTQSLTALLIHMLHSSLQVLSLSRVCETHDVSHSTDMSAESTWVYTMIK